MENFLHAILEGAGSEGAVYASMGTLCNFGPEEFVAIGQALSALPNLVIWKLAPGDLPGNATVETLQLSSNVKAGAPPQNRLKSCASRITEHIPDMPHTLLYGTAAAAVDLRMAFEPHGEPEDPADHSSLHMLFCEHIAKLPCARHQADYSYTSVS